MQKGIIFEIENENATVMKNNGDFVNVTALPCWKKGDVVTIKTRTGSLKAFAAIAACLLLLISTSVFGVGVYFQEAALISLDVNPSIELSVNRFDRVIAVRSLNDEGYQILERVSVKNKLLDDAVSALFEGGLGTFIPQSPLVTFTVFSPDTQREQLILSKLQDTASYVSSHHADAQIAVLSVDENLVNEAHEHHVTAGKYSALIELQKVLPEMEMERYSHQSISYIKEQTKIHGNDHGIPDALDQNNATSNGKKHGSIKNHNGSHH